MEIADRIPHALALLLISEIIAFAIVVMLSNGTYAQTLHDKRLSEVVNQTYRPQENPQIDVGATSHGIGVNEREDIVYVVKHNRDSVSVISGEDNTKIEDIPVGNFPWDIAVNDDTEWGYVSNSVIPSSSVSVINLGNNTKIKDIPVGNGPLAIAVNENTNTVYVANADSDDVSVINGTTDTKTTGDDIPAGDKPIDIAVNENTSTVYVANELSDSVSVISGEDNRKIRDDIPVGNGPLAIAVNENTNTVYVANSNSSSVSVISGETIGPVINQTTNQPLTIPVGNGPLAIAVNENTNTVYVANHWSGKISVISGEDNTKIGDDIPVGDRPSDIAVNENTNTVYVANAGSQSISLIDGETNEVVAGVTLHVNPFGSGRILCDDTVNASPDDLTAPSPTEQYIYVLPGTECIAKPNESFEFVSWAENREDNSTQLLTISRPASIWDSFASPDSNFPNDNRPLIMKSFQGNEIVEPEAILSITKFGTFTANFKQVPAPIPQEYLILFVSVLLTSIATLVTTWFSSRTKKKRND